MTGSTLKTHADGLGETVMDGSASRQAVSCSVFALVKCTMICFLGANDIPSFLAHSMQCMWMLCSVLQLSPVVLLKAREFTLSTKLIIEDGKVCGLQE